MKEIITLFKNKKFLIIFLFFIAFVYSSIRIIYLINDPYDTKKYKINRYTPNTRLLFPKRGNIYDRNGNLLVGSIEIYQIDLDNNYLNIFKDKYPKEFKQKINLFAKIIADNSNLSKNSILEKIKNNINNLSNDITAKEYYEIKKSLEKNKLSRLLVATMKTQKRYYVKNNFAQRLIGAVKEEFTQGIDNKFCPLKGISGIEKLYDKELSGKIGREEYISKASNKDLYYPTYEKLHKEEGKNIYLTIDSDLQEILENNLKSGRKNFSAKKAIGVIINPNTGEILAMAEDDKIYEKIDNKQIRTLAPLAISYPYEPGSSIKPFIMQLALEKKLVSTGDSINCKPYLHYSTLIKDDHPANFYSIPNIIIHSSNVGIIKIAQKLGATNVYNRYKELGFGTKLSLNLLGNNSGELKKIEEWKPATLGFHSFGQGFSCSALQMALAYASIANNGKIYRPLLVKKIANKENKENENFEPIVERIVSNNTEAIDTLKDFLKDVVEYGTATNTKKDYFYICGKTGTPENIKNKKTTYSPNFIGFFPRYSPKYLIAITYIEPDFAHHYASNSAVTTFSNIVDEITKNDNYSFLLTSKEYVKMPNLIGKDIKNAKKMLKQNNINLPQEKYEENEKEIIVAQNPPVGKFIRKNTEIQLTLENKIKTLVRK